jgi:hypothetical protein
MAILVPTPTLFVAVWPVSVDEGHVSGHDFTRQIGFHQRFGGP